MAGGRPSCGSKNSLLPKSARTPASLLPALLGAAVGKRTRKMGELEGWGAVAGPEWSRLQPEGSWSQEENNSGPSVARALRVSRSRLPPQLLQVQRGGGSSPESGTWGSQTPGGPGRWDWERARGTQNVPPGVGELVIHSHPRSLRTYPCPSRPASGGDSAGEAPLVTWRALPLYSDPYYSPLPLFLRLPSADTWRQAGERDW